MSDYVRQHDFSAKTGTTIFGSDVDDEFDELVNIIQGKVDESREGAASGIATLNGSALLPVGISGNATSGGGQVPEASATTLGAVELANTTEGRGLTDPLRVITPDILDDIFTNNAGILKDLYSATSPGADRILFWDQNVGAVTFLTASTGLSISGTTMTVVAGDLNHDSLSGFVANEHIDHSTVSISGGNGLTGGGAITTSQTLAVGAGTGISVAADTVAFDPSGLTEIGIEAFSQSQDGFVVHDNGTPKVMPYDQSGIKVVLATDANQTFSQADANTFQYLDSVTNRVWTIPPASTFDFDIGTVIIVQSINTAEITITAGTGVVLSSVFNTGSTSATSDVVLAGGRAVLIKVANDEWTISGDIKDS